MTAAGSPQLVKLPGEADGYEDSGEGGLAFFLLVRELEYPGARQRCSAGGIAWPQQDVIVNNGYDTVTEFNFQGDVTATHRTEHQQWHPQAIDAGLLIGSTKLSLWSDALGHYFAPEYADLTPAGQNLFHALKALYGADPSIVTLLDT